MIIYIISHKKRHMLSQIGLILGKKIIHVRENSLNIQMKITIEER